MSQQFVMAQLNDQILGEWKNYMKKANKITRVFEEFTEISKKASQIQKENQS